MYTVKSTQPHLHCTILVASKSLPELTGRNIVPPDKYSCGWGNSSTGKVLVEHPGRTEFDPQHPHLKKSEMVCMCTTQHREVEIGGSSMLIGQQSYSMLQAPCPTERSCFKISGERLRSNTWGWSHIHLHKHIPSPLYRCILLHT